MQRVHSVVLAITFLGSAGGALGMEISDGFAVPDPPRLVLTFVECEPLPNDLLAAVQEKTAALVETMGVRAEIHTRPSGSSFDPDTVTLIVMDAPRRPHKARVMGVAKRKSATRALWIFSSSVAAGARLRWDDRHRWSAPTRDAFATAMARVAVHEIVHIVCPWRRHDEGGLMAEVQGATSLLEARPELSRALRTDFVLGVDALSGSTFEMARAVASPRR
jgi:hypothetical protein